ncbi:MAG: SpoIID/LytB domain-containing protein [Firmicutes bacterium]|nr:SpoIID/LytB domain-containing protein [Bacillota bacterium]
MKRKTWLVLVIVALVLVGTLSGAGYVLARQAETAAIDFMDVAVAGSIESDWNENPIILATALGEFSGVEYSITDLRLTGLSRAWADVALSYAGESADIVLEITRGYGVWSVTDVSGVESVPGRAANGRLLHRGGETDAPSAADNLVLALLIDGEYGFSRELDAWADDKLLAVSGDMEFQRKGKLPLDWRFTVFGPDGISDALVGMEPVTLYGLNGELLALEVPDPDLSTIRVNISTDNFRSIRHQELIVLGSEPWQIKEPVSGREFELPPGSVHFLPAGEAGLIVHHADGSETFQGRLLLISASPLGLPNVQRASGETPVYPGVLEVVNKDGALLVVNEVPLEDYLYTVVASEMPMGFGLEALELQAIIARTYASGRIVSPRYQDTGAHAIDSVLDQVYNNNSGNPLARAAVDNTKGQVVAKDDRPAELYFFSTSSGYSAAAHQVWERAGTFPGQPVPWLTARPQYPGSVQNLSNERDFAQFIQSPPYGCYDRFSPWFRWQFTISVDQLTEVIVANLAQQHQENSALVLGLIDAEPVPVPVLPDDPLGELLDIRVAKRGDGGVLMALDIIGSRGSWRVLREYTIRHVLRPLGSSESPVLLQRQSGSSLENFNLLPSAFVYWERGETGEYYQFYGGGFGHGVGLSQYGARELVAQGWTQRQVLGHYFPGTELITLYD